MTEIEEKGAETGEGVEMRGKPAKSESEMTEIGIGAEAGRGLGEETEKTTSILIETETMGGTETATEIEAGIVMEEEDGIEALK